jgi:hypothetical protein
LQSVAKDRAATLCQYGGMTFRNRRTAMRLPAVTLPVRRDAVHEYVRAG